ncbi:MAG: hypothetical protein ACYC3I_09000 [Gemmataceae bacterium]
MIFRTDDQGNDELARIKGILAQISALSDRGKDRLVRELSRRAWFARWALVRRSLIGVLMTAFAAMTDDAIDSLARLKTVARTHLRKRRPSQDTLGALRQIAAMKAKKSVWSAIDRRLGLRRGAARQMWKDARRRGWIGLL